MGQVDDDPADGRNRSPASVEPDAQGERDHREDDGGQWKRQTLVELDDEHLGLLGPSRDVQGARVLEEIPCGHLLLGPRLSFSFGDLRGHVERRLVDVELRHAIPVGRPRARLVNGAVGEPQNRPLALGVVDQAAVGRRDDCESPGGTLVGDEQSAQLGGRQRDLVGVHDEIADPCEGALLERRHGGVLAELDETSEEGRRAPRIDPQGQRRQHQSHGERRDQKRAEQAQRADT
jgi:hypothetical protein